MSNVQKISDHPRYSPPEQPEQPEPSGVRSFLFGFFLGWLFS